MALKTPAARDAAMTAALTAWFARARRDLPWRPPPGAPRDPYHALVSEFMLQQTQVSRVVGYFSRFIAAFPNVRHLADAPEDRLMALWAGLGYYRRVRNLHASAKAVVERFGGQVPSEVEALTTLPGVGRYTAGAIASIVFGRPQPAADGNVQRVLLRVEGRDLDPSAKSTAGWTWDRAGELVRAAADPASWTEGLMELGATVCLPPPQRPRCAECPLAAHCVARAKGLEDRIPSPKAKAKLRTVEAHTLVVQRRGAVMLAPVPAGGLWAGLLAPPTVEAGTAKPGDDAQHASPEGPARAWRAVGLQPVGELRRVTSAAVVRFVVYTAESARNPRGARWVKIDELGEHAVSSAHRAVIALALKASRSPRERARRSAPPRKAGSTPGVRGTRRRA